MPQVEGPPKADFGPNALYKSPPSELDTVLPFPVGIADIAEPTAAPASKAVPVAAKFTADVYATIRPVSKDVNVAVPIVAPRNPENTYRPAVKAPVPHIDSESAPLVMAPLPVGANDPGSAAFVSTKFWRKFEAKLPDAAGAGHCCGLLCCNK